MLCDVTCHFASHAQGRPGTHESLWHLSLLFATAIGMAHITEESKTSIIRRRQLCFCPRHDDHVSCTNMIHCPRNPKTCLTTSYIGVLPVGRGHQAHWCL
jgi:hypothetical protein